jgi:hypothetical protein
MAECTLSHPLEQASGVVRALGHWALGIQAALADLDKQP